MRLCCFCFGELLKCGHAAFRGTELPLECWQAMRTPGTQGLVRCWTMWRGPAASMSKMARPFAWAGSRCTRGAGSTPKIPKANRRGKCWTFPILGSMQGPGELSGMRRASSMKKRAASPPVSRPRPSQRRQTGPSPPYFGNFHNCTRPQAASSACDFGTETGAGLPPSSCSLDANLDSQRHNTARSLLLNDLRAEYRSGQDLAPSLSHYSEPLRRPMEKISAVAARPACGHRPCLCQRATEVTSAGR